MPSLERKFLDLAASGWFTVRIAELRPGLGRSGSGVRDAECVATAMECGAPGRIGLRVPGQL
eukprot:12135402-Alexandrium_andersonii.AAC.1